ncbi:ATP-NAD kinase family protein [Neptunomonas qingdaonensis]|uniref:Predicted polyphosphate-or ATP-dependent NAD kinase n=1 Tax=Neptunomonas qingdaonensis TaxID=1045558 RepID=A0A1I2PZP4_9GAMM|nr:ATP-NAD kinase family protein [Neptunomonas qingdaonensis]SFG20599.1 Predicted polyphosphate-or ATP-dependent NAD kinase [Neptunomonas qingdaonensis]
MNKPRNFKLGLLINPLAGLGGSVALKGSDGADTASKALALGAEPKAQLRTLAALSVLKDLAVDIVTYPAEMGEDAACFAGFKPTVLGEIASGKTTAEDTERAAQALYSAGVDLILFAGGDGTARNICHALPEQFPVLGIPAGVKIHSGVYAVTPKAAGEIVAMLIRGELVTLGEQEVRDIDEEAFRQGRVRAKYYGELLVPQEHRYLQNVKSGGKEVEELVLADIAADLIERMEPLTRYIMGSGSTVNAVMDELGLQNTLLGVDLIEDHMLISSDCTAQQLLEETLGRKTKLVITIIGGQGHILGRGNQQLSPELIKQIGKENIIVIATKTKLEALQGRPLIVDSGDPEVDKSLAGVIAVITGYHDSVLYRIAEI